MERRTFVRNAAWAAPVIAAAVAVPMAAASVEPDLQCTTNDSDVATVTTSGNILTIFFHATAQNAVDVTIRLAGHQQIHYNLAREDRFVDNGAPHEKPYKAGGSFVITLPRPYDRATDWMQIKTVHNENCVEF